MKVKIIYDESTQSGFNTGDTEMLEPSDAAKVVSKGDAHYEKPPTPPIGKEKSK